MLHKLVAVAVVPWRKLLLSPLVLLPFVAPIHANAAVATINGCYDCLAFDTPGLEFNVPIGISLSNVQMVLNGYQGLNNGLVSPTINLGTINAGLTDFVWGSLPGVSGSLTPGNLTAGDYDDEYVGTSSILPNSGATANCGGACVAGGSPIYYADIGNFQVTITATIAGGVDNGMSVFSQFTPSTNATGGFVSFEGLDANGFSEQPCCDIHSGGITNDLADINLGVPPTATPIPTALPLFATGFGFVCYLTRRRKQGGKQALAAA
jgi:hypothetical protein